jgi:hypothetical protein
MMDSLFYYKSLDLQLGKSARLLINIEKLE